MFNIRLVQNKDNNKIKDLVVSTLQEFNAKGPGFASSDDELNNMYEAYQDENKCFYVVELNGEVLGCGGFAPLDGINESIKICELRKMYFNKKLRGKGAGKKLIDMCIAQAKICGFKTMYLETIPEMKIAQKLYISRGFKYLDSAKGETSHSACQVFMQLNLV